jgi:hypothetical protein
MNLGLVTFNTEIARSSISRTIAAASGFTAESNPNVVLRGSFAAHLPGIENPARLNQQQFDLVFRIRFVLDALRYDEHFAAQHMDGTIAKIDSQIAVDDDKRFIGVLVLVPRRPAATPCSRLRAGDR